MKSLDNFLDAEGRLTSLPRKQAMRELAHAYLATKFAPGAQYTEHEVNALIGSWHTFNDFFVLRRGMVESGYLLRLRDGSRYWRNPEKPAEAALAEEADKVQNGAIKENGEEKE